MKISHAGMLLISIIAFALLSGCSIVNTVRARNELNDGAKAYKARQFDQAEAHFAQAMALDPSEKRTGTFMARTLHQQYLTNRASPENMKKAEQAITVYKTILAENPNDETTNDAIGGLIGALKGPQALVEWRTARANDEKVKPEYRAKALTFLAGEKYNCVNEITEASKETIQKGNEAVFLFKKPTNADDFAKGKQCADDGLALIDKALSLDSTKSSPFSYKASLLIQKSRLAEMEGNSADKEKFKAAADEPKKRFQDLSAAEAKVKEDEEKRKAEEEAAK
jgi:tetratricopeptide (TPR) repeat protein